MENEEKKKMKYVPPRVEVMTFGSAGLLAGSIGASSGGWSIDNSGGSGIFRGGWSIDNSGSGSTGASTGEWSNDRGESGTGASTGGWSKD